MKVASAPSATASSRSERLAGGGETLAWDELKASGPPAASRLHWSGIAVVAPGRTPRSLLVPSRRVGQPSRDARSSRKASALAQPWAASDACRLRVDPTASRRED